MKFLITYRDDKCLHNPFQEVLISSNLEINALVLFYKRYLFPIVCVIRI